MDEREKADRLGNRGCAGKDLTQAKLARLCGISAAYLSRVESNTAR
jgi:predicted transcriptional regulator